MEKRRKMGGLEKEYVFLEILNELYDCKKYTWFNKHAYKASREYDNKGIDIIIPAEINKLQKRKRFINSYIQIKSSSRKKISFIIKHGARFRQLYILHSVSEGIIHIPDKDRAGQQPHKRDFEFVIIVIVSDKNNKKNIRDKARLVLHFINNEIKQKLKHL